LGGGSWSGRQTSSSVADFGKLMAPRTVTSYGLDGPGFKPQWGGMRSSTPIQTSSKANPASCIQITGAFSLRRGVKWLWNGLNCLVYLHTFPHPVYSWQLWGQLSLLYLYHRKRDTDTYKMIETVYDNTALSCICIFMWLKIFREGYEDLENDPRCGQPSTAQNAQDCVLVARDH